MDELSPFQPVPSERSARADAWRMAVPPAVFLAHFAGVYGWNGLACSFGWGAIGWRPIGLIPAVVLGLTLLAIAVVWWARPAATPAPADDITNPYDPDERRHFMASTTRMTGWLAVAGMVLVALPSVLARTCAGAP